MTMTPSWLISETAERLQAIDLHSQRHGVGRGDVAYRETSPL
jgi:hypothetical protein